MSAQLWAAGEAGTQARARVRSRRDGRLEVLASMPPAEVIVILERDDVRELVQTLDDWLFDSRPR